MEGKVDPFVPITTAGVHLVHDQTNSALPLPKSSPVTDQDQRLQIANALTRKPVNSRGPQGKYSVFDDFDDDEDDDLFGSRFGDQKKLRDCDESSS